MQKGLTTNMVLRCWLGAAISAACFSAADAMSGSPTAVMPKFLVCASSGTDTDIAAKYAGMVCTGAATALAGKFGSNVNVSTFEGLRPADTAPGLTGALLRVNVSGPYSAKAQIMFGSAAELARGGGRSGTEIGSHMSDASLNAAAAANHVKALIENMPRQAGEGNKSC